MPLIKFETKVIEINSWLIIRLTHNESDLLTSSGLVMVEGSIKNIKFKSPLEPDGFGSHWFRIDDRLELKANIHVNDIVLVEINPLDKWPEVEVPEDFMYALKTSDAFEKWKSVTTKARWEWIRWIRSTKNIKTRQNRIDAACSKLNSGMKRPCCFDSRVCTEPAVSKSGKLIID
ncbi:MAG: YdeI/OmpD-associated family protein [Acidaminobacteraceae bacterium]